MYMSQSQLRVQEVQLKIKNPTTWYFPPIDLPGGVKNKQKTAEHLNTPATTSTRRT